MVVYGTSAQERLPVSFYSGVPAAAWLPGRALEQHEDSEHPGHPTDGVVQWRHDPLDVGRGHHAKAERGTGQPAPRMTHPLDPEFRIAPCNRAGRGSARAQHSVGPGQWAAVANDGGTV